MKLFWKIFSAVFISFAVAALLISYFISDYLISDVEKHIVEENKIISSLISKEIEVDYFESRWPFESLKKLSEHKGFLFWWIVKDNGTIYLADNASFMGTYVRDYFPQMASVAGRENIYLNHDLNYGIFMKPLDIGKMKWSFWFGFSIKEISEKKREIVSIITLISTATLIVLGAILYLLMKYFTKPIKELTVGAETIGKGDLNYRVKIESKDEIGQLASSFNKMTEDLQKTTVSRDKLAEEVTERKRAEEALVQLSRKNQLILDATYEGIVGLDIEGNTTFANPAAAKMTGYETEELVGQQLHNLLHHSHKDRTPYPIERCPSHWTLKSGTPCDIRGEVFWRKNGTCFFVAYGAIPIRVEGKIVGAVVTFRDITQRKQAEEERERLILQLQDALAEVKKLSGLIPICMVCKKIRDDKGYWEQLEVYISEHSEAEFSHGMCPECMKKLYPDYYKKHYENNKE